MRDIECYTNEYLKTDFEQYQVQYRRKKVLETLKKYAHKRILEIGCGLEPLFQYMDNDYEEYTIVEPSRVFCENAVRLKKYNPRICILNDYLEQSIEKIGKKSDFVICSSLLHEVEEPVEFLERISEVCNKGTIVHINVPNAKSLHRLIAMEMGLIEDIFVMSERNRCLQQHIVYDMEKLVGCVKKAGFEVMEQGSYFVKPFSHSQMYNMLKKNIIQEDVLMGLDQLTKYLPEYGSEIYVNVRLDENSKFT